MGFRSPGEKKLDRANLRSAAVSGTAAWVLCARYSLTTDDPKFESLQGDLTDVGRSGDLESVRSLNSFTNGP